METQDYTIVTVDTKGACFLCLKEPAPEPSENGLDSPVAETTSEVCLRRICRYFQMDVHSVLSIMSKSAEIDKDKLPNDWKKCDFSVMMCAVCAHLTDYISELVHAMEMVTMNVNHRLQQFHGILKASEDNTTRHSSGQNRWEEVKRKMTESSDIGNLAEVRLVQNLRHAIKTRCVEKLKNANEIEFPKVCLNRMQVEVDDKVAEVIPGSETVTQTTESTNQRSNEGVVQNVAADDPYKHLYSYDKTRNGFSCLVCQKSFAGRAARIHLASCHPEKVFAKCKLETVTCKQFKNYCKYVLTTEKANAESFRIKLGQSVRKVSVCQFCQKRFSNHSNFPSHLVWSHYENLEKQVVQLQEKGGFLNFNEIKNASLQRGSKQPGCTLMSVILSKITKLSDKFVQKLGENQTNCLLCNFKLVSISPRTHMIKNHPEKCFTGKNLSGVTNEQFEYCCKQLIDMEVKRAIVAKSKTKTEFECPFCKLKSFHDHHLRSHLVLAHYKTLEEKLVSYQKRRLWLVKSTKKRKVVSPVKRKACSDKIKQFNLLCNAHYTKIQNESNYHCPACNCSVRRSHSKLHMIIHHPEKIFAAKKLDNVTEEEFKVYCEHVLHEGKRNKISQCKQENSVKSGFQCPYCDENSRHNQNLRYHLVTKHYRELAEKIVQVQADCISNKSS